jgi:hypothetical protein
MKQLINFYTNGLLREDMPFVSIETNWIDKHAVVKEPTTYRSFVCDGTYARGKPYLQPGWQRKSNKRSRAAGCQKEVVLKLYEACWVIDVNEGHRFTHTGHLFGALVHLSLGDVCNRNSCSMLSKMRGN